MEKLQWFKFSPSDWTMGRIMRCSPTAQASYMRLMCLYWNKNCQMHIEEAMLEFSESDWQDIIRFKIVKTTEDNEISISFLDEQKYDIDKMKQQASRAGKASAEKRKTVAQQKLNEPSTVVNVSSTPVQRIPTEKNREEKNREDIYRSFDHLAITNHEFAKLESVYSQKTIDHVLDSIENYRNKSHYTSLYLTAKTWLRDKPTKQQESTIEVVVDKSFENIQAKLKKNDKA
jgi:hypothetical protein